MSTSRKQLYLLVLGAMGATVLALSPLAHAQSPVSTPAARTSADSAEVSKASTGAVAVSRADRKFYIKLAESNLAEIAAAKQAQAKSNDIEVKGFARTMLDEHGPALSELSTLAARRNVELPTVPDEKHRKQAERMADLSAIDFNSQYAKLAVDDHRAMLKLLDKVTSSTKDEELKALAERLKPKVQAHLKQAMELTAGSTSAKSASVQ